MGVSNEELLVTARSVGSGHVIVIADEPKQMKRLYNKGANYVLATKKLSAERIADLLSEHYSDGLAGGQLKPPLEHHRRNERQWSRRLVSLDIGPQGDL